MAYKLMFTLLLITFSVFIAKSQININYKPGLIITNDNDTLYGLIKDRGGIRNSKACYFKKDKGSKSEKFSPDDIKAYMFIGDKYYQSAEIFINNEFKQLFIDVLLKGKVSLYYYWKNEDSSFYIQKDDSELIGLTSEIIRFEGNPTEGKRVYWRSYEIENQIYKDTLRSIFQDSKITPNQIRNVEYNKTSLINITKDYIEETYGTDGIHYIKNLDLVRSQWGFYSGLSFNRIIFFDKLNEYNSDLFITYPLGIFYNIPLPLLNDKLTFQTELLTSKTEYYQKLNNSNLDDSQYNQERSIKMDYRQVGLALLFKYELFQSKIISPSVAFGKNSSFVILSDVLIDDYDDSSLHFFQKGGWILELGIDYKISSKFTIFNNFRIHSLKNYVIYNDNQQYNISLSKFPSPSFKTNVGSVLIGLKF